MCTSISYASPFFGQLYTYVHCIMYINFKIFKNYYTHTLELLVFNKDSVMTYERYVYDVCLAREWTNPTQLDWFYQLTLEYDI